MIKHVIFDFDDTLTASHQDAYQLHMAVAKKLKLPLMSKTKFLSLWGPPWSVFISLLWPGVDVPTFQRAYSKLHGKHTHPLLPGAKKTLNSLLKSGYQVHLLSSRDKKSLMYNLKKHGIHDTFHRIHSADHGQFHKPDPRVFEGFMAEHGLKAEESLYVGDLLIDYEGASKAGLRFVAVRTGAHTRSRFISAGLSPKHIIPSVADLPRWLKNHE